MTHLTDEQLNEVLDAKYTGTQARTPTYAGTHVHTYTGDTSTLRHLDTCPDCKERLEEMRALFANIESLPEVAMPRDLTSSVMAKLPAPRNVRTWTWLSLAQALGAFAILAWLASSFVLPPEIATYQPPTFDSLMASVLSTLSSITLNLQTPTFDLQPSTIDLQSTTILTFIISAVVLWFVGNGLLLRAPQRNNQ